MQNLSAQDRYCSLVADLKQKNVPPGGETTMTAILAAIPSGAQRIIDLGCNTGWVARQIAAARPDATVTGVDINGSMIDTAREVAAQEGSRAIFACVDGGAMREVAGDVDVIVCGGSAAFFERPAEVYRAVAACLKPGGLLIDCHYLYETGVPAELRDRERTLFGLGWTPVGLSEIARVYEDAGLTMREVSRLPRFRFEEGDAARLARDILCGVPEMRPLVNGMVERRHLIDELAAYRYPFLLVATAGRPAVAAKPASRDVLRAVATLDLFSGPIAREPMTKLRDFVPYRFLAYVGDPDAAPGGGRSVDLLGRTLRRLGLDHESRILDIGCFTGLSTIVLATRFSDVTGLDIDAEFVGVARSVAETLDSPARFEVGDGADTPYPDGSFDAVIMTATLAYTPKPAAILSEIGRVLTDEGLLAEFVYHHFDRRPQTEAEIRAAVGPDIVLAPLSDRLATFEKAGFDPIALIAVETGAAPTGEQTALRDYVTRRERERDPSKSVGDLVEFARLFTHYTSRLSDSAEGPIAFLCVFAKRKGARAR